MKGKYGQGPIRTLRGAVVSSSTCYSRFPPAPRGGAQSRKTPAHANASQFSSAMPGAFRPSTHQSSQPAKLGAEAQLN